MLTTHYVPGSPVWLDLGARDIDAAAGFYHRLFGWDFQSAGPEAGGYGLLKLGGKTVAAIGPLTEEGARPSWDLYFETTDADATTSSVERAGGSVRFEPFDVFSLGRMAGYTDPTGAEFSVWQPRENEGLDQVTDPYTMCWTELGTTDSGAAKDFYREVFSWDYEDMTAEGEDMTYVIVSPHGGGRDAAQGGMMSLPPEQLDKVSGPRWYPYFEVPDCDATVALTKEQGGSLNVPVMDMEGVGRMAHLSDPAGATFSVITSEPGT